jgi:hypothetical protein
MIGRVFLIQSSGFSRKRDEKWVKAASGLRVSEESDAVTLKGTEPG